MSGCASGTFGNKNNEGRIVYSIEYDDAEMDALSRSMLPTEAEYYFSGNKSSLTLSSTGNLFKFSMITNNEKKIVIQELKIMSRKLKAVFNDRDIFYYQDHPGYTILETEYLDTIAGYIGDVSLIIFDDIDSREFPIVYTDEIDIESPNWHTLYKSIPSVLLQYKYMQFGKVFKMRAKSIEFFDVNETRFNADLNYMDITPEDFISELKKLADNI